MVPQVTLFFPDFPDFPDFPYLLDYLKDPSIYIYKDGCIEAKTGPGLGVEINEEFVQKAAENAATWKNPVWRNFDGTIAEW